MHSSHAHVRVHWCATLSDCLQLSQALVLHACTSICSDEFEPTQWCREAEDALLLMTMLLSTPLVPPLDRGLLLLALAVGVLHDTRQGTYTRSFFLHSQNPGADDAELHDVWWIWPFGSRATKLPKLLKITTWPLYVTSRATSRADTNAFCTPATRMFVFTGVLHSVTASNFLKPWSCTHARPSAVTNFNPLNGAAKPKTSPTLSRQTDAALPESSQPFPIAPVGTSTEHCNCFRDCKHPGILLLLVVERAIADSDAAAHSSFLLTPLLLGLPLPLPFAHGLCPCPWPLFLPLPWAPPSFWHSAPLQLHLEQLGFEQEPSNFKTLSCFSVPLPLLLALSSLPFLFPFPLSDPLAMLPTSMEPSL